MECPFIKILPKITVHVILFFFFYVTEFKGILLNSHDPYNCISILQHYKCSGFKGWLFGLCEGRVNTSGFTLLCHSQIGVTHLYLSACWFTAICLTWSQWRIVKPSAMTAMPSIPAALLNISLSPLFKPQLENKRQNGCLIVCRQPVVVHGSHAVDFLSLGCIVMYSRSHLVRAGCNVLYRDVGMLF